MPKEKQGWHTDPLQFEDVLKRLLVQYGDYVQAEAEFTLPTVAKEAVEELKQTSPKRKTKNGGAYAKSWTYTKDKSGMSIRVYNKNHYQLTHLLEKGHLKRNGHDYTKEIPHIEPASINAESKLIKAIEKSIRDGWG